VAVHPLLWEGVIVRVQYVRPVLSQSELSGGVVLCDFLI